MYNNKYKSLSKIIAQYKCVYCNGKGYRKFSYNAIPTEPCHLCNNTGIWQNEVILNLLMEVYEE